MALLCALAMLQREHSIGQAILGPENCGSHYRPVKCAQGQARHHLWWHLASRGVKLLNIDIYLTADMG